jgi:hypothetical protein
MALSAAIVGAAALAAGGAGARVTVTVANTHDSGSGSLREAVDEAVDNERIRVPAGVYRLTGGQLATDKSLRITGAGARRTIIDGTNSSRILEGQAGTTLSLSRLTLRHGNTGGGGGSDGGAVYTDGSLKLVGVAVLHNRTGNSPSFEGNAGGVYANTDLTIRRSLIAKNAGYVGGGAYVNGEVTIIDSTIALNRAGSPFVGDNGVSGAIETGDQPATVLSSTIAFNRCFNGYNCGGAFYNGNFTFRDSIIAGNTAYANNGQPAGSPGNPGTEANCDGPHVTRYVSAGHNIEGAEDCGLVEPSDRQNVDPRLGRLKDNGGPTNTLGLQHGSRAIDRADSHAAERDQRGFLRGSDPDIGAFERGAHG